MKGATAYSASKAGLNAFAYALAREVVRDGINVNVVIPAPVETDMLEDVTFEMVALQASDVVDARALPRRPAPAGRRPRDLHAREPRGSARATAVAAAGAQAKRLPQQSEAAVTLAGASDPVRHASCSSLRRRTRRRRR